jgi:PAS domain-containing protein
MQYGSGGRYEEIYTIIHPLTQQARIVWAKGRVWFGAEQQAYRFNGTLQDVTQQAQTTRTIEENEAKFRSLIDEAPVATCLFVGPDMKVELANDVMLSYWGKDNSILGLPLREAVPELIGQPFLNILDNVFTSGITYSDTASEAQLMVDGKLDTYYFNYTYKPLRDANGEVYAIMDMAVDVTAEVITRRKIQETETSLRSAIELAELATWSIDVPTQKIYYSQRLQDWLGVQGAVLEIGASPRIHPKDQERIGKAMRQAMQPGGNGYFNETYSIVHAVTGQERIIHTNGITRFDENGQAVSIAGTSQDVTLQQE